MQLTENQSFVSRLIGLPPSEWMNVNLTCSDLPDFQKKWQALIDVATQEDYFYALPCLNACWFLCPYDPEFIYIFFTINEELTRYALYNKDYALEAAQQDPP